LTVDGQTVRQDEVPISPGWKVNDADHGRDVERPVEMGKALLAVLQVFIPDLSLYRAAVDAEQHQVVLPVEQGVGHTSHLLRRGTMDEALGCQ
jgi:hypothetical protein